MEVFLPYLYDPSAEATYVLLVTPMGNLRVEKAYMWPGAITLGVLVLSMWVYRWYRSREVIGITRIKTSAQNKRPTAAERQARSALEESMVRKGENSYYYAHQPRTLPEDASATVKKTMVSSYGWTDRKQTVSIYLTDDAVVDMKEDQLKLDWTKSSLSMDLLVDEDGTTAKSLVIPTLFGEIRNVTWKAKQNQLTITLTKVQPTPWTSLNGAAKHLEEHIEYDQSLFD